jgi:TolB protein
LKLRNRLFLLSCLLSLLLAACGSANTPVVTTELPTSTLRPTRTPTATATPVPVTPGEGKEIFFFSLNENGYRHLFAYNPQTLPLTRLTTGGWDDTSPALSPDGLRLAFASNRNDYWDLYLLDLQTGQVSRLTDTPQYDGAPSWSPDGQWITYESYVDDNLEIFLLSMVDAVPEPIRLTNDPAADHSPAWSPGGRQIAFVSTRSGESEIWLANLDEGGEGRFVDASHSPDSAEAHPAWSYDGAQLAWAARNYRNGLSGVYLWNSLVPDRPAHWVGNGNWPAFNESADQIATLIEAPNDSYLSAYTVSGSITLPVLPLPGSVHGLIWRTVPLPTLLPIVFSRASNVTPAALYVPAKEIEAEVPGRTSVIEIQGVQAPYPYLNDQVNESFNALRARVILETNWDALANLQSAYVPLTDALDPGLGEDWLFTGRAFALNPLSLNAGWIMIVREDFGEQTFWRVYLRAQAQDGSLGAPLHDLPWDLNARYGVDPQSYEQGGQLMASIPAGYWLDLTDLARQYNWERLPALVNWRTYFNGARFNELVLTGGLDWRAAILQMYPPDVLVTPTVVVPFTRTPTRTPYGYRTPVPSLTPTPRPTFTPSP